MLPSALATNLKKSASVVLSAMPWAEVIPEEARVKSFAFANEEEESTLIEIGAMAAVLLSGNTLSSVAFAFNPTEKLPSVKPALASTVNSRFEPVTA